MNFRRAPLSVLRMRTTAVLGASLLLALGACADVTTARPPLPAPSQSSADGGPFRVAHRAPEGRAPSAPRVSLFFSRPVSCASWGCSPADVFEEPGDAVAGSWTWHGRLAVFTPRSPLPDARRYRVRVRDVLAEGGASLTGERDGTFETPRAGLIGAEYVYNTGEKAHVVTATFDRDVDPAEAARRLRVEGTAKGRRVSYGLEPIDTEPRASIQLHLPSSAAAEIDDASLVCEAGLLADGGVLGSESPSRRPLEGLGRFTAKLECERDAASGACTDWYSATIHLSRTAEPRSLWSHLRVDGRPVKMPQYASGDYVSVGDLVDLGTSQRHTITLGAGVVAEDGDVLAAPFSFAVVVPPAPPEITLPGLGGQPIVPLDRATLPVRVYGVNVGDVRVQALRVDLPAVERSLADPAGADPVPTGAPLVTLLGALRARKDEWSNALVGTSSLGRAPGTPGFYALVGEASGSASRPRGIVTFTDLGVTTLSGQGKVVAWVTRLSTGEPVQNAHVRLPGVGEGPRTDGRGLAELRLPSDATPRAVVVEAGDDATFATVHATTPADRVQGYVFTDRALYRPGQVIALKGYVRAPSDKGPYAPAGAEIDVSATDGVGHSFHQSRVKTDSFGAFTAEILAPEDMAQGYATIEARAAGSPAAPRGRHARAGEMSTGVYVTEFRPVEMAVEASIDRPAAVRGERAAVRVQGRYLFGGPLKGAPYEVSCSRQQAEHTPPGLEGWETRTPDVPRRGAPTGGLPPESGRLDATGAASAGVTLELPDQVGPERVTCTAGVSDPTNHMEIVGEASVLVHPSDLYVGLRTSASYGAVYDGRPLDVAVAVAGATGGRRAGVPVRVELLDAEARTLAQACDVVSAATDAKCTFRPPGAGSFLVRAVAADAKGRAAWAGMPVRFTTPEATPAQKATNARADAKAAAASAAPAPAKPDEPPPTFAAECGTPRKTAPLVDLWLEREKVAVGDPATICVRAPIGARVLLTVEREGVRSQELRTQRAIGDLVTIPMGRDLFPNARISAYVVGGATKTSAPWHRSAHVDVEVQASDVHLGVTLDVPPVVAPGATIDVGAIVSEGGGRPRPGAQVTLWAIDQAVDSLRPARLPEPGPLFQDRVPVDVRSEDTRSRLFRDHLGGSHSAKAASIRMGATMASPPTIIGRTRFAPRAFFLTDLVTDATGKARATVTMPHNTTTWRVMAVAAHGVHAFGQTEGKMRATQEAVVRPLLPRFLRQGDTAWLGASVEAEGGDEGTITWLGTGPLSARGSSPTRSAAEPSPVRFLATAGPAGASGLDLVFVGKHAKDSLTAPLPIRPDEPPLEGMVLEGDASPRARVALPDLSAARAGLGGLSLRLAATPVSGLAQGFEELLEYPYGCTEQTASRLLPLVALAELAPAIGASLPADADRAATRAVSRLASHQLEGGLFGFWPQSRTGTPWLTLIALEALLASKRAGYTVPDEVIRKATAALDDAAKKGKLTAAEHAMFVGLGGDPAAALERARDPRAPVLARAIAAAAVAERDPAAARPIALELAATARRAGPIAVVDPPADAEGLQASRVVSTAAVLRALALAAPDHPSIVPLARGLAQARTKHGRFASTHDAGWALRALAAVARSRPASRAHVVVRWDGAKVAELDLGPGALERTIRLPIERARSAKGAIEIESDGAPVHWDGVLRWALAGPRRASEDGLLLERVERTSIVGTREPPRALASGAPVGLGEWIDTEIVLVTPVARTQVVLEDPLTPGFEPVRDDLALVDRGGARTGTGDETRRELRDDRVVFFFDELSPGVHRVSYRVRATTAGRFTVPEVRAECMYDPAVRARAAPRGVEVR